MSFNTSLSTTGNALDYDKYRRILEINNPDLTVAYLSCLTRVFRYNGYTAGMEELLPYVEKYMPAGELKTEVLNLYRLYAHTKEGLHAPDIAAKDETGRSYTLKDFEGKILVVDVWATWCSWCIKKLPDFKKLKDKYERTGSIEFITIAVDNDSRSNEKWKELLQKYGLESGKNLLAADKFKEAYMVTGIPRYMMIDEKGKIITLYAPAPGKPLEDMINAALLKYKSNP
jgi:thiol-disulfide isomerase/thioredoxin